MNQINISDEQLRQIIYSMTNDVNNWADINKGINSNDINETIDGLNGIINYLYDVARKNNVHVFDLMWDGNKWLTGYEHEGR